MPIRMFRGKVAIITGGAGGIGEATVKKLLSEEAKVVVFDLQQGKWQGYQDDIEEIKVDIRNRREVEEAVKSVYKKFNRIDILINCAGILKDHLIDDMLDHEWDTVIDVNLKGSFNCCRAVTPYMKRQQQGKIILISSVAALGTQGRVNYAAAKAGIQGLTKSLAIELGPHGIHVNAVAPGYIETQMSKVSEADAHKRGIENFNQMKRAILNRNPIRRIGQPEDVANVIEFLATEKSDYVTGQIIYVSGAPNS
ncbi:SDR family NAD(P)-dependent oxidoreductase [Cytobacillus sp. FSL M8-0252]|uniref:SDR family NAD(P)-dependent oxidoreductase n=1 Tax=Cytobacillus sp. FSL M8-0252 TaxID=2921621 RepID=UPI0030FC3F05